MSFLFFATVNYFPQNTDNQFKQKHINVTAQNNAKNYQFPHHQQPSK